MEKITDFLTSKNFFVLIIYIILGILLFIITKGIINKSINKFSTKKRQKTIKKLIANVIKYIIVIIVLILILNLFGVDVTSILAGLGIVGIIVGLALQDVMKDVLSGIFIILEEQYDIGDQVEIGNFVGEVQSIGLKTTKLKNFEGKIKIISNRNVAEVINYSKSNSIVVIDIPVSYEDDIEMVEEKLNKIAQKISKEVQGIIGDIKVLGIEELSLTSALYRITFETKPYEYFEIKRQILRKLKIELTKNNVKTLYDKLEA